MAEREAKNAAKGACAQIDSKTSHDVIRAQTSPIPVRSKFEETALGPIGGRESGGLAYLAAHPICRVATGIDERLFGDGLRYKGKTLERTIRNLGFAASHNDIKCRHSDLPKGNRGDVLIGTAQRLAKTVDCRKRIWSNQ